METEDYLSGFKMFLMALIPMVVLAILIMLIPYAFYDKTLLFTFPFFVGVVSFLLFLRSKYFWVFKDNDLFDKVATIFIWIIFITVMPILGIVALLIFLIWEKTLYVIVWIVSVVLSFIFGVRIKTIGSPPDSQFILIYNHCSNIDDVLTPVIMGRRPWKAVFAAEAKRIPFVGNFLEKVGIPVSRNSIRSRQKLLLETRSYLQKEKGNLLILPEGRRLLVEKKKSLMMDFQPGAFYLSSELGIPIVPVVVSWTFKYQPRSGQWWFSPRTVTVSYLNPTYKKDGETIEEFLNRTRENMIRVLRNDPEVDDDSLL